MNKKTLTKIITISAVAVCILVLDLVTKYYFDTTYELGAGFSIIPYLFNIILVHNEGAAWGIFSGNQIGLVLLSVVFLVFFIWYFVKEKKKSWLLTIAMAFLIGGCVGNLYDRLIFGYVRDFIQFAFWQSFPVFNFADVFLTFGVILFAIDLIIPLFKKDKNVEKNSTENNAENSTENDEKINRENNNEFKNRQKNE